MPLHKEDLHQQNRTESPKTREHIGALASKGIVSSIKLKANELTKESKMILIFGTLKKRYPEGTSYSFGNEKTEGRHYLELETGNHTFYAKCLIYNENMPSEHIRIIVHPSLDFKTTKAKNIDLSVSGNLTVWDSKFGDKHEDMEKFNINLVLDSLLKRISTY